MIEKALFVNVKKKSEKNLVCSIKHLGHTKKKLATYFIIIFQNSWQGPFLLFKDTIKYCNFEF